MDKVQKLLKKIDNKKVSFDEAFKIMRKLMKLYQKEKAQQIEMDLKFEQVR